MSIDVSVMNAGDEAISGQVRPLRFGFLFRDGGQVGRRGGDERPRDSGRAAGCAQCRDRQVGLGCRRCRTVPQRYEQLQRIGSEHRYRVQRRGVRRSEIGAGKAEETTRLFKANTKTTSPEAKVQLTYVIDDGDKYVYVDPDFAGKAVMLFDLVPNEATAKWAVGLFYETDSRNAGSGYYRFYAG